MNVAAVCIISAVVPFLSFCLSKGWIAYQGSHGLLVVLGNRSFHVCRYTSDDFLGSWSSQILDRRGRVFLADENRIRRLKQCDFRLCLSEDELGEIANRLQAYSKICIIRNHLLVDRARKLIAWEGEMLGNWPRFPKPPERSKDDIIVSAC